MLCYAFQPNRNAVVLVDCGMSNQFLIHPDTGLICFGYVHFTKSRGDVFLPGEIRLTVGRHFAPHRGYGATHIWAEHQLEMQRAGFGSYNQVSSYVATIVRAGARLHFEGQSRAGQKLTVLRSSSGIAVLQWSAQRAYWSVVTAYSKRHASGTMIGKVHSHPDQKNKAAH